MVDTHLVQQRGVQVVDIDPVLDGPEPELVGRSVGHSASHPASGQPRGEPIGVMVAAGAGFGDRSSAELSAPDDQRFIQEPSLLQVGDQAGTGPVHVGAALPQVLVDVVMVVPRLARTREDLHVSHAPLDQPPGQQARVPQGVLAVQPSDPPGLAPDIKRLAGRKLHPEGGFHGLDSTLEELIFAALGEVHSVEFLDQVQLLSLFGLRLAWVLQEPDHLLGSRLVGTESRALEFRRQET